MLVTETMSIPDRARREAGSTPPRGGREPDPAIELSSVIYGAEDIASPEEAAERRVGWIRSAVEHHISTNDFYAALAARMNFSPSQLNGPGDLARVPTLSSALFKRKTVCSTALEEAQPCTSSGTRGTKSVVWRDQQTLERFVGSVTHGIGRFFGDSEARRGFVIGPSTDEAGDLWFSYVLSLINLLFDTTFYVRSGVPQYEPLLRDLRSLDLNEQPVLIAPPSLLLDFLTWMGQRGESADLSGAQPLVVTSGGWKLREAQAISRSDLEARARERLGVEGRNCRDFFNMVEVNSVIFECEAKRKHIPPWLAVIPRNVSDMSPQPYGKTGLLTFLDPSATSYPAFICSEDFGSVELCRCECGRAGEVLSIQRRLSGIEERGCGQKMNRYALHS